MGTPMGSAHAQRTETRAFVVYVCSSYSLLYCGI